MSRARALGLWAVLGAWSSGCDPAPQTSSLKVVSSVAVHVTEPSDLLFSGGRLYTVSDQDDAIITLSADGTVSGWAKVDGVPKPSSFEAIADGGPGELVVARESKSELLWVTASGGVRHQAEIGAALDANSGLEGLARRPSDGHLFALKEKNPTRLIHLDPTGGELARLLLDVAADLSGLAWLCDDELLAVSQEEHRLFRLRSDGTLVTTWDLPDGDPEGVAYDGQRLYVLDETTAQLATYELALGCH